MSTRKNEPEGFFALWRRRIARDPTAGFDRRFWARFENEFGSRGGRRRGSLARVFKAVFGPTGGVSGRWLVPAAATLALVIAVPVVRQQLGNQRAELARLSGPEAQLIAAIVAEQDLVAELDLFFAFEDLGDASDEEWRRLLDGTDDEG